MHHLLKHINQDLTRRLSKDKGSTRLEDTQIPYIICIEFAWKKLSIYLSIFTGSLIYEHYTRECEFGNFDKIKNKKHKKKKKKNNTKKHKNFWLNFCLNKECPKLLCGLGICHRRRQTIPMWNSTGEKRILQGITVCLVSAVLCTM